MPMNVVIQEKRKELGLTQEQVAKYLNVSIPAVSKWETGTTSPDISLLAPLARLLKIDLNTLLCFHKNMTSREIGLLCEEIREIVRDKGIDEGFMAAEQKFHEYPHDENLLHTLTIQLDGLLGMSELEADEAHAYDERIIAWYRGLADSTDRKIRSSANFMLASRMIRNGEYEKAQEALNRMPDPNDIVGGMADPLMLQVEIDKHLGNPEKAAVDLQRALYLTLGRVQQLLFKLMDMELERDEISAAQKIAGLSAEMVELFELWKYNAFIAPLRIAFAKKDVEKCVSTLRDLLAAMREPWNTDQTLLFYRMRIQVSQPEQMISMLLSAIKKEPLLQGSSECQKWIAEYERFKKGKDLER